MSALDGTIDSPNFDIVKLIKKRTAQTITSIQQSKYVLEVNLHTIICQPS